MEKALNNSLYEQILYTAMLQICQSQQMGAEAKTSKAKDMGEVFGRKTLLLFSRTLPHTAFSSTEKILQLISADLWSFIFGNATTDTTSPTTTSISFKDNNLLLLRRLDAKAESKDKKDEVVSVLKFFIVGIITGILLNFKVESEVRIIFQNESLFVNINCE